MEQPEAKQSNVKPLGKFGLCRLNLSTPDYLDSLEYVADAGSSDDLQLDQVEVEVEAIGLHSNDYLAATGKDSAASERVQIYNLETASPCTARVYPRRTHALPGMCSLQLQTVFPSGRPSALPHGGLVASRLLD